MLSPYDIDKYGFTLRVDWVFPTSVWDGRVKLEVDGGDIGGKKKIKELYLGAGSATYLVSASSSMVKVIANLSGLTDRLSVDLAPLKVRMPKPFERVALSDIPEIASGDIRGGLQKNKVYWQREVWVAGGKYDKALGIHADPGKVAWAEYRVPSGAAWFRGYAGLARQGSGPDDCKGHFDFRVLLNKVVVKTREFNGTWLVTPEKIDVPVTGNQILRFEVTDGGDGGGNMAVYCDHATLVSPYFE